MQEKLRIELGPVQETLLLPLWGRAVESGRRRPRLSDAAAVEVMEKVDYDFRKLAESMSEISRMAWIARSLAFDGMIRDFLERNPGAVVVNIGCGLDTTFERVDDGKVTWVDLDLPDVIELRRRFMSESARHTLVSASIHDDGWTSLVPGSGSGRALFVAAGVLYYFTSDQVRSLFHRLGDSFAPCEIIYDSASPAGVDIANKRVIAAGGMSSSAILQWGIRSARELEQWDDRIHVVDEYPMFKYFRRGLGPRRRLGAWLSDRYRIMSIVHLRIE